MSHIPTIRVKSTNPEHHDGFFLRNADDLRYGEELFMAAEFERLGEHSVRIKMESLPSDDNFVVEGNVWLKLKAQELSDKVVSDRIAREEEAIAIAKSANTIALAAAVAASEANQIALSSRRISISSAIAAIVAAIAAIKWR